LNRIKRLGSVAVLATALSGYHNLLRAQDNQQAQDVQQNQDAGSGPKDSGLFLNTTQSTGNAIITQSLSESFLKLGSNSIAVVGGGTNTINLNGENTYTYDIGAKYSIEGTGQLRFTYLNSNGRSSYGPDWDLKFFSSDSANFNISLLGDLSTVFMPSDSNRHIDFGIGEKFNFDKSNNLFFIVSERGTDHLKSLRVGYMYLSKERLAALLVDHTEGFKDVYSVYLGLPQTRVIGTYDPNSKTLSTVSFLTFGNGPIPEYPRLYLLSNQFILTQRSVPDSDNTHGFPPTFFLTGDKPLGDFFRIIFDKNPMDRTGIDFDMENAMLLRTKKNSGFVLTQNATKDALGIDHFGGGFGYKFRRLGTTPVVILQSRGLITFGLNFSY
jgi:hypothetical protein